MSSLLDKHFSDSPAGWIVPWEKTTPQGKIDLSGFLLALFILPFLTPWIFWRAIFPKE